MRNVAMLSALVVLALLLCLPAGPAWGAIYYVSTDGNDTNAGTSPKLTWRTIAHAAKKAQAGDLVRIKGGEYGHESVSIANSGTPEAPIRFEGYDGQVRLERKVEKVKGKTKLKPCGVSINGNYVKISGITVFRGAIAAIRSHHVTIENCTAGTCGWAAIELRFCHHCQVRRCTAHNANMVNFVVSGGHDNTVADCWSYNDPRLEPYTDYCYSATNAAKNALFIRCRGDGKFTTGHGICITRNSGPCSNIRVSECEMYNCWELFGVRHGSHDITFDDCYGESKIIWRGTERPVGHYKNSTDWSSHGFYFRCGVYNITVKNCRVRGVMRGLEVAGGRDPGKPSKYGDGKLTGNVTFENCIAVECLCGIYANAVNTRVINCLSARNKEGISVGHLEKLSITGCIVSQNETGITSSIPTANAITRCNVWGNKTDFSEKAKPGAGCISKDPQFATVKRVLLGTHRMYAPSGVPNQDWDDWRLKEASPCRDMGPYAADPKASIGMR